MTANQFVAALRRAGKADRFDREGMRAWATVPKRPGPAFDHPPDPLLDLVARYDVSGVVLGQFRFTPARSASPDNLWRVAERPTYEYYQGGGHVHVMHCHAAYPDDTGLTTGGFLAVLALYAEFLVAVPPGATRDDWLAASVPFAGRAAAISPDAPKLDWFCEGLGRRDKTP